MADEYVRREILDLYIERMEAISEKNLAKHDAIAAEMRTDNARYEAKVDALLARLENSIDALENKITWSWVWLGIIIWLVSTTVQHIWK